MSREKRHTALLLFIRGSGRRQFAVPAAHLHAKEENAEKRKADSPVFAFGKDKKTVYRQLSG